MSQEAKDLTDLAALIRLGYEGEDGLRQVAAILRGDNPGPRFLKSLADHIDPDRKNSLSGVKLVVKRRAGHRPKRRQNHDLQHFMELNVDVFDQKHAAVVSRAMEKFDVSETACNEALRAIRRRRDPEFFQVARDSSGTAGCGLPEYQPFA